MPPFVHIRIGLPSWTVAEQVSVRDCPAMARALDWIMLTVGGERTGIQKSVKNYKTFHMLYNYLLLLITYTLQSKK